MTSANQPSAVIPFPKAEQRKPSSIEQDLGQGSAAAWLHGRALHLDPWSAPPWHQHHSDDIILQLLEYWVDPARKPFPTKKDNRQPHRVTDKTVQTKHPRAGEGRVGAS